MAEQCPPPSHQLPQHCYYPAAANPTQRYTSQHLRSGCQSFHRFHNNLIEKEEYHINYHYTHGGGTYSAHYKRTDLEKIIYISTPSYSMTAIISHAVPSRFTLTSSTPYPSSHLPSPFSPPPPPPSPPSPILMSAHPHLQQQQ